MLLHEQDESRRVVPAVTVDYRAPWKKGKIKEERKIEEKILFKRSDL